MEDLKLAILIDADNISPKYVKVILDEAATFGVAACKRIYGDWSDVRLKSWKDALLNNSIIPIQQYSYTTGKNATDSAMIIDAMDLLYGGNLDKGTKNPNRMLGMGIPFTKRPIALQFDYKVKMSDRENRIRATGFSKITDVPGKDFPAAILLLQKRWEDAEGNIFAKRVGTMVVYYYNTGDWHNNATYEIHYGDITGSPIYKPHMMRLQVDERYSLNSKGESVPVREVAWADKDETPTHMILQFTASHGGAYIGSPGNTLWVDNVKLVYVQ